MRIQARVCGPQPGIRLLAHATKGIFHGARLDRPMAGGNGACSEVLGKDLKEGDWVGGQVVGVHPKAVAESGPEGPGRGGGMEALVGDTLFRRRLNSAPIRSELVEECRGSIHGNAWG